LGRRVEGKKNFEEKRQTIYSGGGDIFFLLEVSQTGISDKERVKVQTLRW
jgi:hypothetical protein